MDAWWLNVIATSYVTVETNAAGMWEISDLNLDFYDTLGKKSMSADMHIIENCRTGLSKCPSSFLYCCYLHAAAFWILELVVIEWVWRCEHSNARELCAYPPQGLLCLQSLNDLWLILRRFSPPSHFLNDFIHIFFFFSGWIQAQIEGLTSSFEHFHFHVLLHLLSEHFYSLQNLFPLGNNPESLRWLFILVRRMAKGSHLIVTMVAIVFWLPVTVKGSGVGLLETVLSAK